MNATAGKQEGDKAYDSAVRCKHEVTNPLSDYWRGVEGVDCIVR